jgi:ribose transport system ATP-binding protein
VDVGAKREIYNLIQKLASEGLACIVISSELPEIIGLCHRAVVMRDGKTVGEVAGSNLTEEAIMYLAAGVAAA